jgi:hypothetical protein
MEVSDVRRRVNETLERAKRAAVERRAVVDEASRDYATFLEQVAVPLLRQIANVLKAQSYPFTVNTPGASVRLVSDKSGEDFVEIGLDSTGRTPVVMGHSSRRRGGRIIEAERPVAAGPVSAITDEQVLTFVLEELETILR